MIIRSIRTRLTLWFSGLLALTFLILGVTAYLLVSYTLHKETDSALRSVAEALAREAAWPRTAAFPPDVDEVFRRFFGFVPMAPYFEWLDPRADLRRESGEPAGPPLSRQARQAALRGIATFETVKGAGPYPVRVLTWPVIDSGRVIAVVRVGMSQMSLSRTLSHFLLIMAALFPLALALAGGGGWFFAHRALEPRGQDDADGPEDQGGSAPREAGEDGGETTSWTGWPIPSMKCSAGWRAPLRRCASLPRMPPMSCKRPSPFCAAR